MDSDQEWGPCPVQAKPNVTDWRTLGFQSGDKVHVCIRKDGRKIWKEGTVADLNHMRPVSVGNGEWAFPVIYSDCPLALAHFNPAKYEMHGIR